MTKLKLKARLKCPKCKKLMDWNKKHICNQNEICECGHKKKSHQYSGCCMHKGEDTKDKDLGMCPCKKFVPKKDNHSPKEQDKTAMVTNSFRNNGISSEKQSERKLEKLKTLKDFFEGFNSNLNVKLAFESIGNAEPQIREIMRQFEYNLKSEAIKWVKHIDKAIEWHSNPENTKEVSGKQVDELINNFNVQKDLFKTFFNLTEEDLK